MKKLLTAAAASATLAIAGHAAAISYEEARGYKNGGQMTVTYQSNLATLDPAIGYDWQNWSMIKSLFNGLMGYEPGTTNLITDLASDYTISDDGTVYTFKLREGVQFHNGREMTAEDVKYSIERTIRPSTQSPGAGFYDTIQGFKALQNGEADHLEGVKVVDDYTVEFHLSRPDAPFLHKLALNFAFIVPEEVVKEYGDDFGKNPVGTGAFELADWTLGQRVVFERNEDYYRDGIPNLDKITFSIGQEPVSAMLRLQRGEVDILGDGIPPARFLQVSKDPEWKDNIKEGRQLHTGYIAMNTNMKPFDDPKVRKAVNMAVNKKRAIQIINGRAEVANQPLPPAMPGHASDYEGYPYDPEKARELMAEAGYEDGVETELFVMNVAPNPRIVQSIQKDLSEIGMDVSIKSLAQSNVISAGGQPDQAPMIWSGGMAWIADFPDPSNFYGPILGCGGAVKGGWNWSWYCNEEVEKMAEKADAMSAPDKAEERLELWRDTFLKVMEDAPWAPIFHEKRYTMHSSQIAGPTDEIFVDPVHIPVHYDTVYATDVQ